MPYSTGNAPTEYREASAPVNPAMVRVVEILRELGRELAELDDRQAMTGGEA